MEDYNLRLPTASQVMEMGDSIRMGPGARGPLTVYGTPKRGIRDVMSRLEIAVDRI